MDPPARSTVSPREDLQQQLAARLARLCRRGGGLALGLWGAPGLGKTHTAQALLHGLPCRSCTVHAAAPFGQLVQRLPRPRRPGALLERSLARLDQGLPDGPDAELSLLLSLLRGSAPVLVHVEDLHEAGSERAELWQRLAQAVVRTPGVGLLVTSRREPPPPFQAALLPPLDRAASDQLLLREAGADLPPEALAWIWRRAAGNPLFTLEYFRFLARQGHVWNDARCWRWREPRAEQMPAMVEALIERALLDAGREVLLARLIGMKALLPRVLDDDRLAALCDLSVTDLQQAAAELGRRGVLSGGDFVHPLYRELALGSLPPEQRRTLARRALSVEPGEPSSLVRLVDAAELDAVRALEALLGAAGRRRTAGDPVGAARLLAHSLRYADPDTAARLALEAARDLQERDVPEATRLAERAALSPALHSEATWLLAELLAAQGQGQLAEERLGRLPAAEREGPAFLTRVLGLRANDNHRLIELLDRSPGLLAHADPETMWRAGRALAYQGRVTEAGQIAAALLERPQLSAHGRAMALKIRSVVAQVQADFAAMERLEHEVLSLVQPSGNLRLIDAALFNRAMALGTLGRHPERAACLEQGLAVCHELGDLSATAIAQVALAEAQSEAGNSPAAEAPLLEARAVLLGLDVSGYLVDCECALSRLYQRWQPPHGPVMATRYASAAVQHARELEDLRSLVESLPVAAQAAVWAGQPQQALALGDEALQLDPDAGLTQARQAAQAARGAALAALHREAEAMLALQEAEQLATQMGDLLNAQLAGLELDRLRGDPASAAGRLAWFIQRGLGAGVDQVRRRFPDLQPPAGSLSTTGPRLRLEVLGELGCGPASAVQPVRGQKRRALLAWLLEARLAGRPGVAQLDLLDALYPGLPERQAQAALRDLVHQLRAGLGAGALRTTPDGYALGDVDSDAAEFLAGGDTRLWRGPYLSGLQLERRDDAVPSALYVALQTRAAALIATDPQEAARLGRLLLEADPYDLAALRLTLTALRAAGNHRGLGRTYQEAGRRLLEVGEHLPERWSDFLEEVPDPSGASA
ncbi:hypothetical protein [Deinococcus sonorensis]|uniref:Bacterial transcriptional activator domain-containing protein n=2 Tax=Deinococcus sonorensis TaxID=309891 RepID=A0AAU7U3X2_9DEIO